MRLSCGYGRNFALRIAFLSAALGLCRVVHALPPEVRVDAVRAPLTGPPKLFLICATECHGDFLRQELSYFDFTRDLYLADYSLLIVRQPHGGGGERYTVKLSRRNAEVSASRSASFAVSAGTSEVEARVQLLQAILRLLLVEFHGTSSENFFEVTLPSRSGGELSTLSDGWNYWVITPEIRGMAELGSGFHWVEGAAALSVRRVTSLHKLLLGGSYHQTWSGYLLEDGSRIHGSVRGWGARALYARSLASRWALGALGVGRGSEYENLEGHVHGGPVAEFNVFPYEENARRQLRLAYQIGAWANWYWEPNQRGHMSDVFAYHALALIADINESWGSVQWITQGNQFLSDPALYRVSSGAILSLRIATGLALSLDGKVEWIRDLAQTRGRQVTDEELLLGLAQQPTDFFVEGQLILSYAFGSVHNTIVNPRFGRIDLQEE